MTTTVALRVLKLVETYRRLAVVGNDHAFVAWCLAPVADCLEGVPVLRKTKHTFVREDIIMNCLSGLLMVSIIEPHENSTT